MSTSIIIHLTAETGTPLGFTSEPEPGSVVLINGEWGTAFQRHFGDGLWHRTGGGRGKTWEQMLKQRNLVLVYSAAARDAVLS